MKTSNNMQIKLYTKLGSNKLSITYTRWIHYIVMCRKADENATFSNTHSLLEFIRLVEQLNSEKNKPGN